MPELPLIEVRLYEPEDLDGVTEVFFRSVRETESQYTPKQIDVWTQIDHEEWAEARNARPTWVAIRDDRVVGFIDLQVNGLIDMLYVHPAYQRRGVATALLARVEAEAGEAEVRVLHTYASLTAQPFFEHCGYTMLLGRAVIVRGERFIQCVMEKIL